MDFDKLLDKHEVLLRGYRKAERDLIDQIEYKISHIKTRQDAEWVRDRISKMIDMEVLTPSKGAALKNNITKWHRENTTQSERMPDDQFIIPIGQYDGNVSSSDLLADNVEEILRQTSGMVVKIIRYNNGGKRETIMVPATGVNREYLRGIPILTINYKGEAFPLYCLSSVIVAMSSKTIECIRASDSDEVTYPIGWGDTQIGLAQIHSSTVWEKLETSAFSPIHGKYLLTYLVNGEEFLTLTPTDAISVTQETRFPIVLLRGNTGKSYPIYLSGDKLCVSNIELDISMFE